MSSRSRRAVGAILVCLALLAASSALPTLASTLTPGHRVWTTPGIDHEALARAIAAQRQARPKTRSFASEAGKGFGAHGQRMLVIPVLFANSPSQPPVATSTLHEHFFGAGQSSVRGYFEAVSGGRFVPDGVVLPWTRLPGIEGDYVNIVQGRPSSCGNCGPRKMVTDALREAAVTVDLSIFDDDGPDGIPGSGDDDGRIDLLVVLHPEAGFENDPVDSTLAIPAHQDVVDFDGVLAATADAVGDAYVAASSQGPLGVWVHEIAHLLGLEDLYDLDVTGSLLAEANRGGLGRWSLMAHGAWGGEGATPSGLDAVSRHRLGWEDRHVIVEAPATEFLDPVRPGLAASLEVRPFGAWRREHFLLEMRERSGGIVDGDLPGSGVLVYRVDDRVALNRRSIGYWVELLEADGRRDLFEGRNNGEASDAFTAGELGPATNPSSQSRTPSPDRVPPLLQIEAPGGNGRQRIDVFLSETPMLRLARSLVVGSTQSGRAYLRLGETAGWDLRLENLGPSPATASLDTVFVDPRLEVLGDLPATLVSSAGRWQADPPLSLRSVGTEQMVEAARIVLAVTAEGGTTRQIELRVPVGLGPGLAGEDFLAWAPAVVQVGDETTEFTPLDVFDLPLPADAGWVTTTGGEERYANGVELTLTSPWFASDLGGKVQFWARFRTEGEQRGQAYDGAALELQRPDRNWQPLLPTGSPTALIVSGSGANTRGTVGLGGEVPDWAAYEATLPPLESALRVRVRFASDESIPGDGLALAMLGTDPSPGRAEIEITRDAFGQAIATASFRGYFERITTVRFRYRRPVDDTWRPASNLLLLRPDLTEIESLLTLPDDSSLFTIGIFAEAAGVSAPPILLGQAGYRALATGTTSLRASPNPARGSVQFAIDLRDEERSLIVYDVRGRRVRTLQVPGGWKRITWDGMDDGGERVAAGRYVVVLAEDPSVRRSIVLLP